jgi:hypothetical protein
MWCCLFCYADCHFCSLSIMLSIANKLIMLSVIMLNVVMLSVITLSVVAPVLELHEEKGPLL